MRKAALPPIKISQCTDIGRRRHENQDSMGYLQLEQIPYQGAHLLVVADGMGGASGGQVASTIAVREILSYFQDDPNMEPDVALREAVEGAAQKILEHARKEPSLSGMGTTCVVLLALNGYLFAAHVGDSRIYLFRDGQLSRLTRDHSAVQRLVEAGILTEEEAKNHPRQNVLSRVLGSEHPLYVEIMAPPLRLQSGDRIMQGSDGLHGEVSDEDLADILATEPIEKVTEILVKTANDNGGNDNITVQVLAYGDPPVQEHVEIWHDFFTPIGGYFASAAMLVLLFFLGYIAGRYAQFPPPLRSGASKQASNCGQPSQRKTKLCRPGKARPAPRTRAKQPTPRRKSVASAPRKRSWIKLPPRRTQTRRQAPPARRTQGSKATPARTKTPPARTKTPPARTKTPPARTKTPPARPKATSQPTTRPTAPKTRS